MKGLEGTISKAHTKPCGELGFFPFLPPSHPPSVTLTSLVVTSFGWNDCKHPERV